MHSVLRKISFPFLGYVFLLLGFVGLGTATAALAVGATGMAVGLGIATVASFGMTVVCFLVRRAQIARADAADPVVLSLDLMTESTDRRAAQQYLRTYRRPARVPVAA